MPSTELTKAIVEQNQRLVAESVERNFPVAYQSSETESDEDESLLARIEADVLRSRNMVEPDQEMRKVKRLISAKLYHYLSSLAETPRALRGGDFPIWEYLPQGAATMLGLSGQESAPEGEISRLMEGLTREFRNWLLTEEYGRFVTPWIEIKLHENDSLQLQGLAASEVPALDDDTVRVVDTVVTAAPKGRRKKKSRNRKFGSTEGGETVQDEALAILDDPTTAPSR
ncbi:MAG: hypothetical protein ABJB97_10225 [Acidobacteriota bacterium]